MPTRRGKVKRTTRRAPKRMRRVAPKKSPSRKAPRRKTTEKSRAKKPAAAKKPAVKKAPSKKATPKRAESGKKPARRKRGPAKAETARRRAPTHSTAGAKVRASREKVSRKLVAGGLQGRVADLERRVKNLQSERSRLERRLQAAVQEIGALRTFELRTAMLERDLAERERVIAERDAELATFREAGAVEPPPEPPIGSDP